MALISALFGFKASLPDGQGPVNPAAVQAAQKTILSDIMKRIPRDLDTTVLQLSIFQKAAGKDAEKYLPSYKSKALVSKLKREAKQTPDNISCKALESFFQQQIIKELAVDAHKQKSPGHSPHPFSLLTRIHILEGNQESSSIMPLQLNTVTCYAKIATLQFVRDARISTCWQSALQTSDLWKGPGPQYDLGVSAAHLNDYFASNKVEAVLRGVSQSSSSSSRQAKTLEDEVRDIQTTCLNMAIAKFQAEIKRLLNGIDKPGFNIKYLEEQRHKQELELYKYTNRVKLLANYLEKQLKHVLLHALVKPLQQSDAMQGDLPRKPSEAMIGFVCTQTAIEALHQHPHVESIVMKGLEHEELWQVPGSYRLKV